ncbi:calcium uptake protein 3, mitochondrial-like isoform X2 [Sycon ciliatum]|uniref:calcium uptake protein 3, mitochondrial-like isoform X2 n=1 Tax=Sycon ciliatum TaxID=27933 RepID=UPI0031F6E1D8
MFCSGNSDSTFAASCTDSGSEMVIFPYYEARRHRKKLSNEDVARMLASTPALKKGSQDLFRQMWQDSLFSYADYLFMLSVLTKPQQHFQIAFRMLDVDGNKSIELNEFLKFQGAVNKSSALRSGEEADSSSLLCHFFGQNGSGVLRFQDFFHFMDNLQREVLELEFKNHSQGMKVINELEFAEILLRTAHISEKDVELYIERLRARLDQSHGITFDQFCNFDKFLNNLHDFSIVVKMYTVAGHPITKGQFQRAVKACMGYDLDEHLIDTVFKLFDTDGDGRLSHEEFIVVMQKRVQRGFGGKRTGWDGYKACVRKQVSS